MILRELSSDISRSYLRFAFFNAALDSAFKDTREGKKKLQLTQRLRRGSADIGFETYERSAISFRPLPFAFLDGERLPLTGHLRDKATRGVERLHATLRERARYSDILISGVFLLATSSPPLRDIHPLHGIYYPLSTYALCTPVPPRPSLHEKPSGITLLRIRQFLRWLFFHGTF